MNETDVDKLLNYSRQGLIPGPGESGEAFFRRAEYCLALQMHLEDKLPFFSEGPSSHEAMEDACEQTSRLYDVAPRWVPVFFSNYRLMPWHGGCAWIFQLDDASPTAAFFQLRQAFERKKSYLGLYDRQELMAHEIAHVGRMMYEEPKFEEILAYRTSKSAFRRWWGPLVQSSAESMWFMVSLLAVLLADAYLLLWGEANYFWQALWLKAVPLGLIVAAILRLIWRQSLCRRALNAIEAALGESCLAQAVLYRLTDAEITAFASMLPQEVHVYAKAQKCLRWHLLRAAYFGARV